jgi:hypothetical protein
MRERDDVWSHRGCIHWLIADDSFDERAAKLLDRHRVGVIRVGLAASSSRRGRTASGLRARGKAGFKALSH